MSSLTRTADQVLVFWPNLIGYGRVALLLASLTCLQLAFDRKDGDANPNNFATYALALYLASFAGDLVDGWVARRLNQTSSWGGVLDMVTDRGATLVWLMQLSVEYAHHATNFETDSVIVSWLLRYTHPVLIFQCLALLDLSSHWCQMYASLFATSNHHHKSDQGNAQRHFLVQWFYKYYWFFGYLCVGAELTYLILYAQIKEVVPFESATTLLDALLLVCLPGWAAKQVVNVAQLSSAAYAIASHDAYLYNNQQQQQQQQQQQPKDPKKQK